MTINSSSCAYINISSQVEISVPKICQQATWQQTLYHHAPVLEGMGEGITDRSSALFLWIPNEIKSVLGVILKLGLTIFLIVLLICLIKIIAYYLNKIGKTVFTPLEMSLFGAKCFTSNQELFIPLQVKGTHSLKGNIIYNSQRVVGRGQLGEGFTRTTIKDTRTKSRGRVEVGKGDGFSWGGVGGWGKNADNCN